MRLQVMYGIGTKTVFSFGLEYILDQYESTHERHGTQLILQMPGRTYLSQPYSYHSSDTYQSNYLFAKSSIDHSFEVYSSETKKVTITPALEVGLGIGFGDDDSAAFAYESDATCATSYSFGAHAVVLEVGYRIIGSVDDYNFYTSGFVGSLGYSFAW
jgi:hypothetical protein